MSDIIETDMNCSNIVTDERVLTNNPGLKVLKVVETHYYVIPDYASETPEALVDDWFRKSRATHAYRDGSIFPLESLNSVTLLTEEK